MNWVQRIVIASCLGLTACGEPIVTTDWKVENAREHLDLMWHAVNELHQTSRRRYEAKRDAKRKQSWCSRLCGDIPDTLE